MLNVIDTGVNETLQAAAVAVGNGAAIDMKGYSRLSVDVSIATTATVTFEGTIDDTNWFAVGLKTWADGVAATAPTATGQFKMPPDFTPLSQFRARISAWTAGAVTVKSRKDC